MTVNTNYKRIRKKQNKNNNSEEKKKLSEGQSRQSKLQLGERPLKIMVKEN